MDNLFSYENPEEFEEDQIEEEPEFNAQSMPLILAALDKNDFSYYDKFGKSEEEKSKKWGVESYPALRWLSCVGNNEVDWAEAKKQGRKKGDKKGTWPSTLHDNELTKYYLIATNEIANIKFWDLGNHKKLLFLLMACIGQGHSNSKSTHNWINMPKKRRGKNLFEELLVKLYSDANSQELKLLSEIYSDDKKLKKLCQSFGYDDEYYKKIKNSRK